MSQETTFQSEAILVGCGFETGFYSKEQVVQWADHWIGRLKEPPIGLIEISMLSDSSNDESEIAFEQIGCEKKSLKTGDTRVGFLGLKWQKQEVPLEKAIQTILKMAKKGEFDDDMTMVCIDQDLYLSQGGWDVTLDEVAEKLEQFLEPYMQSVVKQLKQLPSILQESSP